MSLRSSVVANERSEAQLVAPAVGLLGEDDGVRILVGLTSAFVAALLVMLAAAFRARRRGQSLTDVARLVPDLARLLSRLLRDRTIPLRVRARILIAIAYNVQPINVIPDFVPVIGLVDNLLVILWALRSTVRHAGREVVARHWSGTAEGLAMLFRAAGLQEETAEE